MAIVVVIVGEDEAAALVNWAWHFARARETDVLVLHPADGDAQPDGKPRVEQMTLVSGFNEDCPVVDHVSRAVHRAILWHFERDRARGESRPARPCPSFVVKKLTSRDAAHAVLAELDAQCELLIVAHQSRLTGEAWEHAMERRLFKTARCDTLLLRLGKCDGEKCRRILAPTSGGPHASTALLWAHDLAEESDGQVDALFVEPRVGGDAKAVGQQIIERHVRRALGHHDERVRPIATVDDSFKAGLTRMVEQGRYDLVLVGASNQFFMRWMLFAAVPEKMLGPGETGEPPREPLTIGVMRRGLPWSTRLGRLTRRVVEAAVPQLDRADRVSLVERVQGSSRWDFDFISLICLSTSLAALGLIRNSAAVVIGAMLVAPLMTPLVGAGLALVQGNRVLMRTAAKAVVGGFCLAFVIGAAVGWLHPGLELTPEMQSRGSPNVLDLAVALVGGVAAAYASARPNLSAALPGVAIAAALVPPIATAGIAFAGQRYVLCAGALLLFVTNIIAIVIGAAASLAVVGMHVSHDHHGREHRWMHRTSMALIVITAILCVPLGYILYRQLPVKDVPSALVELVEARAEAHPGVSFMQVDRLPDEDGYMRFDVVVAAPSPPTAALAEQLAKLLEQHYQRPCRVNVAARLVVTGTAD